MGKSNDFIVDAFHFEGFALDASRRTLHRGDVEIELRAARRSIAAKPGYAISHAYVAAASASLGDMDTARDAVAEFWRLQPNYSISTFRAERHCDNAQFLKQRECFYEALRTAGLPEKLRRPP